MVSQTDIDELSQAINTGTLRVNIGDKSVTYRSLEEMRQILMAMKSDFQGTQTQTQVSYVQYISGY